MFETTHIGKRNTQKVFSNAKDFEGFIKNVAVVEPGGGATGARPSKF